ncbi:hypothetical protein JTB14_034922 [Gonioctena quinquepunctata]|nr:hypothetical protein JTB14_034922 [Gonioctena quinquepunctata]
MVELYRFFNLAFLFKGFSGTFPKARNAEELREALLNKLDMTTAHYRPGFDHPELPKGSATINEGLDEFDCGFFGLTEHLSQKASIEVRMLLEKSIEAIMDAGLNPKDIHNTRTNVYIAFCFSDYEFEIMKSIRSSARGCIRSARTAIGMSIAHFLKIKGKVCVTDTACSSSLHSIDHAYRAMRMGECENALVVTANFITIRTTTLEFALLGVLSKDGVCKPFDEHGDGYVRSEAASAILLQKAKNSKRIYAQIIHSKCNSDGFKETGITFPSRQDQANVIEEVLIESNIDPKELTFVEAHATGTAVGDPEECAGIDAVIAKKRKTPLLVGSIKGNLGHSEQCAASSSVIKCLLSMENGLLFPNIHYSVTKSTIDSIIEGRIKVVQEVTKIKDQMPLMGVNSFGFGGSNSHALIRAMTKGKVNGGIPKDDLPRLVCVSGRTPEAVSSLLDTVDFKTLDAEYISLLNNVFRTFIPNHRYAGYSIVSKTGDWYLIYKQFSLIPIFADSVRRVQGFFERDGIKINNTILNPDQGVRKSYVILGSLTIQLCLTDVLKKICLPITGVIGYSFGELIRAYYDGVLDLETVLACGYILNGEPVQNYEQINGHNSSGMEEQVT